MIVTGNLAVLAMSITMSSSLAVSLCLSCAEQCGKMCCMWKKVPLGGLSPVDLLCALKGIAVEC